MANAETTQEVSEAALGLINRSRYSEVDGEEIAREIGRPADDVDIYYALREIARRGELECHAWRGGMGLPAFVRLPPAN